MNTFTGKNRRLLYLYCETLRTIASVVLILGLLGGCGMAIIALLSRVGYWPAPKSYDVNMIAWLPSFLKAMFFWIGVLGLVQFIRHLVERDYEPGWILRHGEIIFYVYALLPILNVVWYYMIVPSFNSPSVLTRAVLSLVSVFSTAVRVLVPVGLGRILRHLMAVIEESKTLV